MPTTVYHSGAGCIGGPPTHKFMMVGKSNPKYFVLQPIYLFIKKIKMMLLTFDDVNFAAKEQCKLYCQADGYNFFYALSDEVKDGTPCNDHSSDICVHGKCQVKISS